MKFSKDTRPNGVTDKEGAQLIAEALPTNFFPSLIAELVKHPLAMQETLVQFLSWEDLLEKG